MTGMPSRALLLEDLPDVAAWLATLLRDRFPGVAVAHAGSLAQALRQICTRAQLAYGSSSSAYRLYHLGPISALSAQELIRASHYICPLAQQQLAQLAPQGLTATIIADTQAIATTLDTLLDTEFSIQQQRQAATHHRIELGNALYILLIPISEKGKLCWAYTNEARYNDYLLVPSQP